MNWVKHICTKIGYKEDLFTKNSGETLYGVLNSTYRCLATESKIVPDDCTTIDAVTSATANTFGDFVEVKKVNSGTKSFRMYSLNINDITENGIYILELHSVEEDNIQNSIKRLASVNFSRVSAFTKSMTVEVRMENICEDTMIAARIKKSSAGEGTVKFVGAYYSII